MYIIYFLTCGSFRICVSVPPSGIFYIPVLLFLNLFGKGEVFPPVFLDGFQDSGFFIEKALKIYFYGENYGWKK